MIMARNLETKNILYLESNPALFLQQSKNMMYICGGVMSMNNSWWEVFEEFIIRIQVG